MKLSIRFILVLFTLLLVVHIPQGKLTCHGENDHSSAVNSERNMPAHVSNLQFKKHFFIGAESSRPVKSSGTHDPANESREDEDETGSKEEERNAPGKNEKTGHYFTIPFRIQTLYSFYSSSRYSSVPGILYYTSHCKYILFNVFRV